MRNFLSVFFTALIMAASAVNPAAAQSTNSDVPEKWGLLVGAGAFVTPKYSGDDNYRVLALPFLRGSYGDNFYASVPEGANYRFYKKDGLTLKAKAGIAFPREEDGESLFAISGSGTEELQGLGDINPSIELGGALDYEFGPLTLSAGLRHGIGGHGDIIGDASVSLTKVFKTSGPPIALILTPNIRFGGSKLTQTYYGITPEQSLASGLPEYETNGGIYSVGINALTFVPTSKDSAFILFASLRELTGPASESPLLQQRGQPTQAAAGLFWVKAFGQDARNAEKLVTGR